jgi:trans-2,3-dihydro-3-hydroxyanthranilate isomerase
VVLPYLLYDVFTRQPLTGNQLAVFLDGSGLAPADMQQIAREMNLSESTFILPRERDDTDVRMRIFTPAVEMPMAGHPTVGSTFALAKAGVIDAGRSRFVFGLNVGPTPVDIEWSGSEARFVWMTQANPVFGPIAAPRPVVEAIGLELSDLRSDVPLQQVSCGVPYLIVPLCDVGALGRAVADAGNLQRLAATTGTDVPLYLFAPAGSEATALATRMFAPGLGVTEDPATGSAAGPLGCYLVEHRLVTGTDAQQIVIAQGTHIRRPSVLHVSVTGTSGAITQVKVGGQAVLVGRGELSL